jgi:peptidoglycan/LPS O-acetylase OafA/YrhL
MTKKTIYLPGLNGIRAIAAIAVVVSHIILNLENFGLFAHFLGTQENGNPQTWNLAGYGVTMFFTLSGFLITFLLCKEKEIEQIDIKKFYARRILRIWPLYYAYFLICIITYLIFQIEYEKTSILYYFFYSANIPFVIGGTLPFLAHFWSLGVEEQFYMFWPWLNKLKINQVLKSSIILTVLLIGTKTYLHIFNPNTTLESFIHVTRFHCMMIGGIVAIVYYLEYKIIIKILTNKMVQLLCWFIFFLVAINRFHIASFLDTEFFAVVTSIIIVGQVTRKGIISLENKYLDFLGKISYGIYVVHPLLIFLFSKILKDITSFDSLNYLIVFGSIIGSTIIISYLSYRYFESKFLIIKSKKYSVVKSSASKNYTQH